MTNAISVTVTVNRSAHRASTCDPRIDAPPEDVGIARDVTVALDPELLTPLAVVALKVLPSLSAVDAAGGVLVQSSCDAEIIYRHNARLALAREGVTSSFMRDKISDMAAWEADLRDYRSAPGDGAAHSRLTKTITMQWRWRTFGGTTGLEAFVNKLIEEMAAFGRPVRNAAGAIELDDPDGEFDARAERVRDFARGNAL